MGLTRQRLDALGRDLPRILQDYRRRVGELFAEYVRGELAKQHTSGVNLYGERYPRPKRGGQPMLDTGELMHAYVVRVTDSGRLVIDNTSPHTIVDHDGRHTHLPDERGIPEKWKQKLAQIRVAEARKLKL